jgi:hypothetical protein
MEKHIMFMGRKGATGGYTFGPFSAQWDPRTETPARIDIGHGEGIVIPADAPDHDGATFVAERYDILGRRVGIMQCQVV